MGAAAREEVGRGVGELEGAAHEEASEDAAGGVTLLRLGDERIL